MVIHILDVSPNGVDSVVIPTSAVSAIRCKYREGADNTRSEVLSIFFHFNRKPEIVDATNGTVFRLLMDDGAPALETKSLKEFESAFIEASLDQALYQPDPPPVGSNAALTTP